jgi:hypothetical protein
MTLTNRPTSIIIQVDDATHADNGKNMTIYTTKVSDVLGNKDSFRITTPFQTTSLTSKGINLRRIDEKLTISGLLDKDSSNVTGDDTARDCMFRLRNWILYADQLKLLWGSTPTSATGDEKGITLTGFIEQIAFDEEPQDSMHAEDGGIAPVTDNTLYKITFTFAQNQTVKT